jgi:hypothetical protein
MAVRFLSQEWADAVTTALSASKEFGDAAAAPAAPDSPAERRTHTPHLASSSCSSVPPVLGSEARSGLIAADRPATARVAVQSWSQRYHQHPPGNLSGGRVGISYASGWHDTAIPHQSPPKIVSRNSIVTRMHVSPW